MRFLRNLVDKARQQYAEPGSKLHKFWPAFDSIETFLFTPDHTTPKHGPHVRDYMDLKRTMTMVIIATIPCLLMAIYNTGYQHFAALAAMAGDGGSGPYPDQVGWLQALLFGSGYAPDLSAVGFGDRVVFGLQKMLPILLVSYGVGLSIEVGFAIWRKEEVSEGYLVSGILIALIVPPSIPLWQLALACAFTVVLAKEVFGGTGMNIFNPAMMARAFLFFASPAQMSGDFVWVAGNGTRHLIDGYSAPTPLAVAANAKLEANHFAEEGAQLVASSADAIQQAGYSWWDMFVGLVPGSAGETSTLACLIGALFMIWMGVCSWRTIVGGVIGLVVMSLLFMATAGSLDGIGGLPPHWHRVAGGFAVCIVFMATDPVSSPETYLGRWIYGFLIGAMTILVRAVNPAYPEGMMLSVLLLNAFAPLIDHFIVQANVKRRKVRLG